MKFFGAVTAATAATVLVIVDAFGTFAIPRRIRPYRSTRPPSSCSSSSSSSALSARPDSSDAVAEAQRLSKEFGANSKEARLAWEAVEEIDSSDYSSAMPDPAISTLTPSESRKVDYQIEINSLAYLLEETKDKLRQMRALVEQIRSLELSDPALTKLGPESAGLKEALREAKAAIEVHGLGSDRAMKAWENLELCANDEEFCDINANPIWSGADRYNAAALKAHHYYDAVIDPELLTEFLDAFDSIETLKQFVSVEKKRLDKMQK